MGISVFHIVMIIYVSSEQIVTAIATEENPAKSDGIR